MNSLKKRTSPFDTPINSGTTQNREQITVDESDYYQEEVVQTPKRQPVVQRAVVQESKKEERDKFTSTMETKLRRRIKVYCAENGILFAEFVEQACKEKLKREGVDR